MFFDENAVKKATPYAVIGSETASELGLSINPVGQVIRIQNIPFIIVGITKTKGDSVIGNADDFVLIPITTLKNVCTEAVSRTQCNR